MESIESQPAGAPQLLLDQEFADMGSYSEALGGWDLHFRQLDRGRLRARAVVIAGQRSAVMRVEFNCSLHQQGTAPPGVLSFGLPERAIRWCGVDADVGEVLNFNMPSRLVPFVW